MEGIKDFPIDHWSKCYDLSLDQDWNFEYNYWQSENMQYVDTYLVAEESNHETSQYAKSTYMVLPLLLPSFLIVSFTFS